MVYRNKLAIYTGVSFIRNYQYSKMNLLCSWIIPWSVHIANVPMNGDVLLN